MGAVVDVGVGSGVDVDMVAGVGVTVPVVGLGVDVAALAAGVRFELPRRRSAVQLGYRPEVVAVDTSVKSGSLRWVGR